MGLVDLERRSQRCRVHPEGAQAIGQWAIRNGFDAMIWAGLPSNHPEKRGSSSSVAETFRYLMSLKEPSAGMAREYLLRAPLEIVRPLRERLWVHPWLWSRRPQSNTIARAAGSGVGAQGGRGQYGSAELK